MVEYWLKNDVVFARGTGTNFERYDHDMGWWTSSRMLGSEIRNTGDWYPSNEVEIVELIERYADEHPTTSYVGRLRDPSLRSFQQPDFLQVLREWREPPAATPLTGAESFVGTEETVADFWRFAMGDLRTNNVRGYLAEFLVAKAVDATQRRVEWDPYDVITPDGVSVEVKTSAYLQVWAQYKPSEIKFSGLRARTWTPQSGYSSKPSYNAYVYVFCVQTTTSHAAYDQLDLSQWDFYVMPKSIIAATGQDSLVINRVKALSGGATKFEDLAATITTAAATNQ